LPCKWVKGVKLSDGNQLLYPLNGLTSLFVTLGTILAIHFTEVFGPKYNLGWIADNHLQITVATLVFSFGLSIFLYAYSFMGNKLLAAGGNTGTYIYDYFIGRELNPRILGGKLDLKYFNELRPGLLHWGLYNIAFAYKQSLLPEAGGRPDAWMILVLVFEGYYILDAVMNEAAILTTMDIATDGFGWMLAFGDLAWVPALYSL
jgi:Delta14-sterol reductase